MYIIIEFSADGIFPTNHIGPFDSEEDAVGYANENFDYFEVCYLTLP